MLSSQAEGLVLISYNRPKKNNAFDASVSGALITVFSMLNDDRSTSAALITGRGAYFCTAAKFDEMLHPAYPTELHLSITTASLNLFDSFINFGKILVAAVNGLAFGGGVT